jgi:hypothetical protein
MYMLLLQNTPLSTEIEILIISSVVSIIGLFLVYFIQKKGYLNYAFVHFVLLAFSILFLLGSSFLLYTSYKTYSKRLAELETVEIDDNLLFNTLTFDEEEASVYIDLKENSHILLGYETYLKQSAQEYDPSKYSYANVLKEELINKLSEKEGTQQYWDDILNEVYAYDSSSNFQKGKNYNIMWAISNEDNYPNTDLGKTTDVALIKKTSINDYFKRKLQEINRDANHIKTYWRENKAFLFTFFSKSKYDDYCKTIVDDLIAVKERVNEQPNYKIFYERYNISDPEFLDFPDKKFVKSFKYSWPFSFWDRRYEENNDDIVFSILKEIQNHYQN